MVFEEVVELLERPESRIIPSCLAVNAGVQSVLEDVEAIAC